MSLNEWPRPVMVLVEVREPLPPIADGESVTVMTDDVAFSGFFRGVLVDESDD